MANAMALSTIGSPVSLSPVHHHKGYKLPARRSVATIYKHFSVTVKET